jgi:hypothetical protein
MGKDWIPSTMDLAIGDADRIYLTQYIHISYRTRMRLYIRTT